MKRLAALGAVLLVSCGPPAAPVLESLSPASPSSVFTPEVIGTATANYRVIAFGMSGCNGPAMGEGQVDPKGKFRFPMVVGFNTTTTVSALAITSDNVRTPCSNDLTYTHDSIAPDAPVVSGTTPASPSTSRTPKVNGTAETGATVRVYSASDCSGTELRSAAAAGGAFSIPVTVASGSTTRFFATATDAAGNTSACSSTSALFTHDNAAPAPPAFTGTTPASPTKQLTVALQGTAEPGAKIDVYKTFDCSGTIAGTSVATDGYFSVNVTLTPNTVSYFYATATDASGQRSGCGGPQQVDHDNIAPGTPVVQGTTPSSPSTVAQVTVTGTADPFAYVALYVWWGPPGGVDGGYAAGDCPATPLSTTYADAAGAWSIQTTVTSQVWFLANSQDSVGNATPCSNAVNYNYDPYGPWGGQILDGPGPTDLDWSTVTTAATVSWSDFYDPLGVDGYRVWLASTIDCLDFIVPQHDVGAAASTYTFSGLSLPEGTYFSCVLAKDTLGNWSWSAVPSNGFTLDSLAPWISAQSPAPGDITASRYLVDLTFLDGPVDRAGVEAGFSLKKGATPVAVTPEWPATMADRVTFTPTTPLEKGTTYTVTLTGIRDAAGNTMADTSWTFTTGAAWRPQEQIDYPVDRTYRTEKPAVARLPGEETLIVYLTGPYVILDRALPGNGAIDRMSLYGYGDANVVFAFNAAGAGGVAFVDYVQTGGYGSSPMFRRYLPDPLWANAWSAPAQIETTANVYDRQPQLAIDDAGDITALWIRQSTGDLVSARYNQAASTWGANNVLDTDLPAVQSSSVAVDAAGNITAVWAQQTGVPGPVDALTSRWTPAAGWSAPATIGSDIVDPRVMALANGEMLAVWNHAGALRWNRYVPGTGWGTEAPLVASVNAFEVASGGGEALVVWEEPITGTGGATTQIRAARWASGASNFAASEAISAEGCAEPAVGLDAAGAGAAAFRCGSSTSWLVKGRTYVPGTWGPTADLSASVYSARDLRVAARAGEASVIWFSGWQSSMGLYLAVYE